jgi:hypothetical protein
MIASMLSLNSCCRTLWTSHRIGYGFLSCFLLLWMRVGELLEASGHLLLPIQFQRVRFP